MCRNKADGGYRCASHTRPGFQTFRDQMAHATTPSEREQVMMAREDDVLAYASTPSGNAEVRSLAMFTAHRQGENSPVAGFLSTMAERGQARMDSRPEWRKKMQRDKPADGNLTGGKVVRPDGYVSKTDAQAAKNLLIDLAQRPPSRHGFAPASMSEMETLVRGGAASTPVTHTNTVSATIGRKKVVDQFVKIAPDFGISIRDQYADAGYAAQHRITTSGPAEKVIAWWSALAKAG
jgi:hypothetical protein